MQSTKGTDNTQEQLISPILTLLEKKGVDKPFLSKLRQNNYFVEFLMNGERLCQEGDCNRIYQPFSNKILWLLSQNFARSELLMQMKKESFKCIEVTVELEIKNFNSALIENVKNKYNLLYSLRSSLTRLEFDMYNKRILLFLKSLRKHKFPSVSTVDISFIEDSRPTLNLMTHSFPSKVKELACTGCEFNSDKIQKITIGRYFPELIRILPRVTEIVYLYYFKISERQLRKIYSSCRDKLCLQLCACVLNLKSVPDMSKPLFGCTLETLSFHDCGRSGFSNWAENLDEFENLIHGLSKSEDLRKTLKKLDLRDSFVSFEETERILEKFGINSDIVIQGRAGFQ
ncbi:unnamed protein product [Moneuplotes crassus]|uniref:Uncharacterized protein n=1 Tax=Euplotes crassus TaxID=5936 RepID=A0AAD2D0M5_EUPCR|nr:unnamed protein product [Moneuplotes crassus]